MSGNGISLTRVTKCFGENSSAQVVALEDITLEVEPGELVTIVGQSGCGKTTLLRIVAGLDFPTAGKAMIDGSDISGPSPDIGFVFQHAVLFPWLTVLSNVLLPIRVRGERYDRYLPRAQELLERSGIADFQSRYPMELSGGMRQRAAICRALLLDPKILLMDEPFGALDAMTRDTMNVELFSLWQATGKTIVFVTHSITEAVSLGTRTVVMSPRPGRIVNVHDFELPVDRDLDARTRTREFATAVTELRSYFLAARPSVTLPGGESG